jgi:Predicted permeases
MKPSVFSRYLVREAGTAWLGVTLVLLAVLVTNRLARLLGEAAGGEVPAGDIFALLGLAMLANLHVVLPASLFLGIVLALGRLYRDSEMAAFFACGVGPREIYRALLLLAVPAVLATATLSLTTGPWAQRQVSEMRVRAQQTLELEALRPGRFLTSRRAEGVVYIEGVGADQRLQNIFTQGMSGDRLVLISAQGARQERDPNTGERFLVLEDGYRVEGVPGSGAWRMIEFQEHGIRVAAPREATSLGRRKGWPLTALLASGTAQDWAEIQWRLSTPLMTLLLTFVVVPLTKSDPREGRYGKLLVAVVVFALYTNFLTLACDWVGDGLLPVWLGPWWVHAIVAVTGAVWLVRRFGLSPRRRREGEAA